MWRLVNNCATVTKSAYVLTLPLSLASLAASLEALVIAAEMRLADPLKSVTTAILSSVVLLTVWLVSSSQNLSNVAFS